MYLRRLDLHGFKAFADRQHLDFGPGLTVIVGPNGSGKSNIADAIRWALGEQSARQIRARKTEDVVFSGSDLRRQLGSAEVTLTLDNSDGWMPLDFSEVTVTRRAYRSGDGEYLLNGQRVRLHDVRDTFRRAHVGQNSYAMMSQGLVDEVLALRPQERRELIEEAANVRGHRQQLTLSERRLSETRDNLGRVRMLIRELAPRLRQLERQSRRAEQYRELDARLQDALCVYYEQELRSANDALAAARAAHDQHAQAFAAARAEHERLDGRLEELAAAVSERRRALESLRSRERSLSEERLRLEQSVALAEQRLELLGGRSEELERELASASEELPAPGAEEGGRLDALGARVEQARIARDRDGEALRSADDAARAVLRELAEAEVRRARLEAEVADAERRMAEEQARREHDDAGRAASDLRRATMLGELRDVGARSLELRRRGVALAETAADARRRRDRAEGALEDGLRALIESRDAVRAAEARVHALGERRTSLEQLAGHAPAAGAATSALLEAARGGADGARDGDGDGAEGAERGDGGEPLDGILGAISQLIRVPDGLEAAVEAALAEQLAAVVVERERDAVAAIEYLREHEVGSVTLFPLDGMAHNYPLNLFNERGVVGIAARLVRTEQRYRPLVDTLLGRTIVVDDLDVARRMVKRGLGSVVTRDGVLLRPGGAYYGGRTGAAAGHFALRRELDAIPEQMEAARRAVEAGRERLREAERAVGQARQAVERARAGVDEADELARSHQQQVAAQRREQAALAGEMRELRRAAASRPAEGERPAEAAGRLERARRALGEVAEQIVTQRDRSQAVGAERDAVAERVTAAAATLAAVEAALRSGREQHEERAERARRARDRVEQLRAQADAARRESEDLEHSLIDLRRRLAATAGELALSQAAVGPARDALTAAGAEERERSSAAADLQARQMAAEREMLASDTALRERAARVQALMQQLADEGLALAEDGTVGAVDAAGAPIAAGEERAAAPVRGGAEVDPAELRERITALRAEIRALGPVNVEAPEDLSEERERHDFLTAQVEDLESAERELREAIEQLRREIRSSFDQCFELVNAAFGDYCRRFFGGGSAELVLVQAADGEDPGVDVVAQPPGKRISNLAVLSGGERALTSVALLFALLSVNPAPLCVLDEVDAALDEANVERFVDLLREHCDRSQFIVITHNRRTIEAADAIYGISMGEDSTSQLLSLRLADLPRAS